VEESQEPWEVEHSEDQLVVESQEQGEEEVGSEPCELDGTGNRVLMLEVVVLRRLSATGIALDIELALHITVSLLSGEERERLLIVRAGRHVWCCGMRRFSISRGWDS
jgi:hypothetical protein